MRRNATITLHWLNFVLVVLLVAGGLVPFLVWAFALSGLAIWAIEIVRGMTSGPGLKLQGVLRAAHPWLSSGMYLGAIAAITIWVLLGGNWGGPRLFELYFFVLSALSLLAIFHLWRHTALRGENLRRITPTTLHCML